ADKKRRMLMTAQVVPGSKVGPGSGRMHELIVAHGNFLELGPTVRVALEEAGRLNDLENAVVVEIPQLDVPTPAPSRQPQGLTAIDVRGLAGVHPPDFARTHEDKIALQKAVFRRDVTDDDVQQAVAVEVPEIHAHALERIPAKDTGGGGGEGSFP